MKLFHVLLFASMVAFNIEYQYENIVLKDANDVSENSIKIMVKSSKLAHETFLACESGTLTEYRIRKRAELLEK